ncbi:MAG TPA: GGDEF domain-containing protein, partial [Rhodospirillales bacterium]|nr:GGDEF domain-containing protein [Rhodospirillales bacterium]
MTSLRDKITSWGLVRTVVAITGIVVVLTALSYEALSLGLVYFTDYQPNMMGWVYSFSISLFVSPIVATFPVRLLLEVSRLETEVRELSAEDELTGVLNRRTFWAAADPMMNEALRHNTQFALILLDLDNFKKINDSYGHLAGDEALRAIGLICRELPRKSDIVGRYGGEEFIFFLPVCDEPKAVALCQRLHNAIRTASISFQNHTITVTGSIGVYIHPGRNDPREGDLLGLDQFINMADMALYEAKRNGRNQTCIFRENITTHQIA